MPPSAARPSLADLAASDLDAAMADVAVAAVYRGRGELSDAGGIAVSIVLGEISGKPHRSVEGPRSRGAASNQRRAVRVLLPGYSPLEEDTPTSGLGSAGHLKAVKAGDTFEVDGVHVGLPTGQSVFLRVPEHGPTTFHGATWGFDAEIG